MSYCKRQETHHLLQQQPAEHQMPNCMHEVLHKPQHDHASTCTALSSRLPPVLDCSASLHQEFSSKQISHYFYHRKQKQSNCNCQNQLTFHACSTISRLHPSLSNDDYVVDYGIKVLVTVSLYGESSLRLLLLVTVLAFLLKGLHQLYLVKACKRKAVIATRSKMSMDDTQISCVSFSCWDSIYREESKKPTHKSWMKTWARIWMAYGQSWGFEAPAAAVCNPF